MAAYWYLNGLWRIQDRTINWASDTIKAILLTSSYTYDATHQFVSSVVSAELTGYTRPTITTSAPTKSNTDDKVYFPATDATISSVATGQTIASVAIYKQVTNDSDSLLIGFYDPVDLPTNGGGVTLDFDANGALAIKRV